MDTAGLPTEYGSPIYKGNRPTADAACVALSRAAGGVLLGETVAARGFAANPVTAAVLEINMTSTVVVV
jgi:Asp-tRNA(Asn)/Glu-tRNA(Gln) amidotransferase A subunit family amidase